jgi:hypothetical protein
MSIHSNKTRKKETIARIQAVQAILRRWDPMDLAPGKFAPEDEYDDYAPQIVSIVSQNCSVEHLLDHLQNLRTGMICMRDKIQDDKNIALEIIATLCSKEV